MAKKTIKAQMKQRRDTKANWAATNPVLLEGELGIVSDDPNLYKVGDGATSWNDLPFRGFDGTLAQELGTSPNAVISQKVVSEKLTELESETGQISYLSESLYEKLNIAAAEESVSAAFKSDVNYYKLTNRLIKCFTTAPATFGFYDQNKNYLGFVNRSTPGDVEIDITTYADVANAVYVRVQLRNSDYSNLTDEQYANAIAKFTFGVLPESYTKKGVDGIFADSISIINGESNNRNYADILMQSGLSIQNPTKVSEHQENTILTKIANREPFDGFKVTKFVNETSDIQYINATFPILDFQVYANCILLKDNKIIANLSLTGNHTLSLSSGCTLLICTETENEVYKGTICVNNRSFGVKSILFLGTSIPAGSSIPVSLEGYDGVNKYPQMIGSILGCKVYNEAVGSSCVRAYNPKTGNFKGMPYDTCLKSLSQTIADKRNLMDNWKSGLDENGNVVVGGSYGWRDLLTMNPPQEYTTFASEETILGWSFENKIIARYFNQYSSQFIAKPDIVVIEHAHNDIGPNWYINNGSTFYDETESAATEFNDNYTDRSLYPSSMSYILQRIYDFEPRQKVVIFGHYTDDVPPQADRKYAEWIVKAQENCARYWNLPIVRTWEKTQWNSKLIKTTGQWNNGVWENTSEQKEMMLYKVWMADELHPHSDKSGKANMRIAQIGAASLSGIYNFKIL